MSKNFETLLRQALHTDTHEPSPALNRRILEKAELEEPFMKAKTTHTLPKTAAAALVLCLALAGSGTVYAAHKYLTAAEISDTVSNNRRLANAFSGKDAISISETQVSGDYTFTLLGLVSGSRLEPYMPKDSADEISPRQTYAAVAIERTDGSAMPDTSFCVSPLIGGVSFQTANNATMNTLLTWFEQDGVRYHLISCDDLEIFADRGVWLSVVSSFGEEARAFSMDAATGAYSKNESYSDFSALFALPLDTKKANPAAADAYLKNLERSEATASAEEQTDKHASSETDTPAWIAEFIADLTEENINTHCTLQPEYTLTATPDADGWIDFGSVYIASEDMTYNGSAGKLSYLIDNDQNFIVTGYSYSDSPETDLTIQTLKRNADGSFTSEQYLIKPDQTPQ